MASHAHLALFAVIVALSGAVLAAGILQLERVLSPWGCTTVLSVVVAWLVTDNCTLYLDLLERDRVALEGVSDDDVHRYFITSLSMQIRHLTDRNEALTTSLVRYNKAKMTNVHWNLLHHKAMSMYYMQRIAAKKRQDGTIRRASSENITH